VDRDKIDYLELVIVGVRRDIKLAKDSIEAIVKVYHTILSDNELSGNTSLTFEQTTSPIRNSYS